MTSLTKPRIETIDLLKGLVMVIMALDHVRDYFHYSAFFFSPTDPEHSNLPLFFTRWITHFCAPAFSFLAGLSAFMVGKRKTRNELSAFLAKRGLWLVLMELTVINFAWYFDIRFRTFGLLVIWSLGISMLVLALVSLLPRVYILIFSLLLIAGHNLLDNIHFPGNVLWSILHEFMFLHLGDHVQVLIGYPIVPWIAVMALGYYFGAFYDQSFDAGKRRKLFNGIGIAALALFFVLRFTNLYGDPHPFTRYDSITKDIISFFNPNKYPPSLLYLLMTLGTSLLFLANTEKLKGKMVNFFCMFGRVPFFYYILHLYLIHIAAMVYAQLSSYGWQQLILPNWIGAVPGMKGYGVGLAAVYGIWIGIVLLLYPLCKRFDAYKQAHKEIWWLSYL